MGLAKQALVYTLIVHVIVLGVMLVWPVSETQPPSEVFAEVDMVDELFEEPSQSYEDALKQALQEKVANLRANAESALSEEAKSSQVGSKTRLEAVFFRKPRFSRNITFSNVFSPKSTPR